MTDEDWPCLNIKLYVVYFHGMNVVVKDSLSDNVPKVTNGFSLTCQRLKRWREHSMRSLESEIKISQEFLLSQMKENSHKNISDSIKDIWKNTFFDYHFHVINSPNVCN